MLPNSDAVKANDFYYKELERIGIRTANEIAIGEQIYNTSTTRQQNIQKLAEKVASATDYRELANIQATILLEMASMQNELIKIQGITIIMNGQKSLDAQRELERARQQSTTTINSITQSFPKK
jgi:type IV secretion system protein VirB5